MTTRNALQVVLDLAEQNALREDDRENPEEAKKQHEALKQTTILLEFLTNILNL